MYNDYLSINKKFKSSVNLAYDLNSKEKILQYIPTTDLCDVINKYLKSVLGNKNKATVLSGPYGKGKSYLLLIISFLLSKREDRDTFNKLLEKFKKIDLETYNLIKEVDDKSISLLPVIINGNNYDELNQNFMLGLRNSLVDNNIEDIIPVTAYKEAIDLLINWKNDSSFNPADFERCLDTISTTFDELKYGLENYDLKFYKKFEELFFCITHGYSFNPLIANDVGLIYEDVSNKIIQHGYNGIFTIFDEFGVFLSNQEEGFVTRLNKIQSFAEKCNSSSRKSQLHLCCVTHKDIQLYTRSGSSYTDNIETIAGRFKTYRFDRSLEENYQIICSALEKRENYSELVEKNRLNRENFFAELKKTYIFSKPEQIDYIFDNAYPFNPIAIYALIQVSEKIAQNERTLFTFISDNKTYSFSNFINTKSSGLLNIPDIYNYFEDIISTNENFKKLLFNLIAFSDKINVLEENIIKTIIIIKIIDDTVKFNSTINNISLALDEDYLSVKKAINNLLKMNVLKLDINDNSLNFSLIQDEELNKIIKTKKSKKYSSMMTSELLSQFCKNDFYYSKKYNFENCMTRFCRALYLEASKFMQISDLSSLVPNDQSMDGLIINIIPDISLKSEVLCEKLRLCNGTNIILRIPNKKISKSILDKTKEFLSVNLILEENIISKDQQNILLNHSTNLAAELSKYFDIIFKNSKILSPFNSSGINLDEIIFQLFENIYSKTIIFNNDLVNKSILSKVTIKSRDFIVDAILSNTIEDYGYTSAIATIYRCYLQAISAKNALELVDLIKHSIEVYDGKLPLKQIVDLLHSAPYGMRNGIMPFFIARAIAQLSVSTSSAYETVLFYNTNNEIELSASNIAKAIKSPDKYYFMYTRLNKEKLEITRILLQYFNCNEDIYLSKNIECLTQNIKSTVSNLPPVIIKSNKRDNILGLSTKALIFKDEFLKSDINNYDMLFNILPEKLNASYSNLPQQITNIFNEYDSKFKDFYQKVLEEINSKIGISVATLKDGFDLWMSKKQNAGKMLFDGNLKKIYDSLSIIKYNNFDAIDKISYAAINCTLSDWSQKKHDDFFETLDSFIVAVDNYKDDNLVNKNVYESDNFDLSFLGETLYSNILESINDYGESISNIEKVEIVKKVLNNLVK